jgi:hypothetical protein
LVIQVLLINITCLPLFRKAKLFSRNDLKLLYLLIFNINKRKLTNALLRPINVKSMLSIILRINLIERVRTFQNLPVLILRYKRFTR